jgi:hypothetical protein
VVTDEVNVALSRSDQRVGRPRSFALAASTWHAVGDADLRYGVERSSRASSPREMTPVLLKTLRRWKATVRGEIQHCAAASLFDMPRATRCATCSCIGVRTVSVEGSRLRAVSVQGQRLRAELALQRTKPTDRMTKDQIKAAVVQLGDVMDVLRRADPADKAGVYAQLGLRLTYKPDSRTVTAEARPTDPCRKACVRGGT